jgi:hypothetical protein
MTRKIYLAGPLFTEYEQKQRAYEAQKIREVIGDKDIELFSPLEAPINGPKQPTMDIIFDTDATAMDESDIFFIDLANNDIGTITEVGMILQRLRQGEELLVYPVNSDFRVFKNERLGFESSIGFNGFTYGGFMKYNKPVFNSFEKALEQFAKDIA